MEVASARALIPLLEAAQLSARVSVDVIYSAPTPVSALITVEATYKGQEGCCLCLTSSRGMQGVRLGRQFTRGLPLVGRGRRGRCRRGSMQSKTFEKLHVDA